MSTPNPGPTRTWPSVDGAALGAITREPFRPWWVQLHTNDVGESPIVELGAPTPSPG
jgi:hypothetical protein